MHTIDIHDGWSLSAAQLPDGAPDLGESVVPATVPGSVHTDLMAAGLLADPYLDLNETTQHWVGNSTWRYRTTFDADPQPGTQYELAFDGLDTVAVVTLNDTEVARTANMHRGYRFDVTSLLRAGANELTVTFTAVREYTDAVRAELGERPNVYPEPSQYVRKMACNFGWDWGPTVVTAGIWKDVRLEAWTTARLARVRPIVRVDGTTGQSRVEIDIQRAPGQDGLLTVEVTLAGQRRRVDVPAGASHAVADLSVPDAELWWPRGHGDQALYDLAVDLIDGAGSVLDQWNRRIGFRTVTLTTEEDEAGTSFVLAVNDTPLFVRGANWIPDDCFVSRVDEARYRERITQAVDANMNLLRIWGGGIYEKDEFYDVCDELGVLVWQDFLFACSAYPEGEPIGSEVEAEARENVVRLMPHPSLVLWNGNNENIWGYWDWGWQDKFDGRDWGWGFYSELLPAVVAELDPSRPYWSGSPYSGTPDRHPNDPDHGNHHSWEVWNRQDYTTYRESRPRFVSEFGYQGPPNWATIDRAISDQPLTPDSPGMLHHQKAFEGNERLKTGAAPHLPAATSMQDWHYLMQLNQAQAVTFGIEYFRSLRPRCMGAIVWQLNDCWPVTSWAAVDGDGRRKLLWYALRRVYAEQLVTVQPDGEGLQAVLLNDGVAPVGGPLRLTRRDLGGNVLAEASLTADVPGGSQLAHPVPDALAVPDQTAGEVLVAEWAGMRTLSFYAEDLNVAFPAAAFDVDVRDIPEGVAVRVRARSYLRHLTLLSDVVDPSSVVDSQLVDLFPGEEHTFTVRTEVPAADPRWISAPTLRALNDLDVYAQEALASPRQG